LINPLNHKPALILLTSFLALSFSCTVGPDYQKPEISVPTTWTEKTPESAVPKAEGARDEATPEALQHWWTQLGDPILTDLIERSLVGSLDLRTAMARIDQSRAELGFTRGERFPSVDVGGAYDRGLSSENSGIGSTRLADIPQISVDPTDTYSLGLGASWEIDLFGRIRRSVEAALADYAAAIEDYRDVRVVLCADVGMTYFHIRTLQRRMEISKDNIRAQQRSLEIVRFRYQAGVAPRLELAQAESNLASSQAKLPPLQKDLVKALNRLNVLLGERPGTNRNQLLGSTTPIKPSRRLVIGFPADLLRRRPDIRITERRLAAQTARVGVATALLYPRFTILGTIGLTSIDASDFFTRGSLFYKLGPSFSWNIFDAGRIRSLIDVEDALVSQALLAYEKSVLLALEETEDALSALSRETDRNHSLIRTVEAYQLSVSLAMAAYKGGQTDFRDVLDAQRELLNYQDQLAESDGALMTDLIALYRSAGGGWDWLDFAQEDAHEKNIE
jgi:NodT family efflux transporter outer membrane factor (OMF) lipoprotein